MFGIQLKYQGGKQLEGVQGKELTIKADFENEFC